MGKRFEQILHQRRSVNGVPFVLVHTKMLSVVTIRETPQEKIRASELRIVASRNEEFLRVFPLQNHLLNYF